MFTNYCVEHHDVFCIVNELISPQNFNKINTLADFLKNIDALKKRELDLIKEIKEIRKKKLRFGKQMNDLIADTFSKKK